MLLRLSELRVSNRAPVRHLFPPSEESTQKFGNPADSTTSRDQERESFTLRALGASDVHVYRCRILEVRVALSWAARPIPQHVLASVVLSFAASRSACRRRSAECSRRSATRRSFLLGRFALPACVPSVVAASYVLVGSVIHFTRLAALYPFSSLVRIGRALEWRCCELERATGCRRVK